MNYIRIYDAFIKDRRSKEARLNGYFEVHHIVPKCMGGTDDAANLISLTPEDHYFAHLLLAYGHGGKNWNAVHAMAHVANRATAPHRIRLRARLQFGHVRRKLADHYRRILGGPSSKIADKRKHELRHHDGRVVFGNRFELQAATGLPRGRISGLITGQKMTAEGWFSPTHNPNGADKGELISLSVRKTETFTLYHHDGRVWHGTKWDFRKQFGCALVFQHDRGCVQGWYRTAADAAAHGSLRAAAVASALKGRGHIGGSANPNADPNKYRFRVLATGEIVEATKIEIRQRFGIPPSQICAIFKGKQKQTYGIALADQI